jgi:predicted AlkP superfamily phosphohydrolase/phosphomutase
MIFGFGRSKRIIGIGLDGFPYSLAQELMAEGIMPNLHRLAERGTMKKIKSVFPTVSGVAWSAFQTGENPAAFDVFGFVELKPDFELAIPTAANLKAPTLWEKLDKAGKEFAALGIPMTYPAPEVKGFMVSGFLAPHLDERAVSRPEVLAKLRETNYQIDIDPGVAIESPHQFKEDLTAVSEARQRTALALLREQDDGTEWDFFFLHVMDTDRINHFLWRGKTGSSSQEDGFFWDFYRKVDDFLGEVVDVLGDDDELLVCSDHGFCELKWEVQLNRWLKHQGYLEYNNDPELGYRAIQPGSRAVSLVPGRVHLLTESAWEDGAVSDKEYEPLRQEIIAKLRAMRHPETGDVVCKQVIKKEEVFDGPYADRAPDIMIDPCDGYDLKAKLGAGHLFEKGPRTGMHTYDDAMLLVGSDLKDLAEADDITEVGRLVQEHAL